MASLYRVRPWSDSLDFTRGSDSSGWLKAAACSAVISRFSGKGSSTKSFKRSGLSDRIGETAARFPMGATLRRFIYMFRNWRGWRSRWNAPSCYRCTIESGNMWIEILDHPQTVLSRPQFLLVELRVFIGLKEHDDSGSIAVENVGK